MAYTINDECISCGACADGALPAQSQKVLLSTKLILIHASIVRRV